MHEPTLITICSIAFASVFGLLAFLAVVIRIVTEAFPVRRGGIDPAIVAAISGTVSSLLPGARVTHIEEER